MPIISAGWQTVQDTGSTQYTATVRTRTWSGGQVKLGTPTDSDLMLSPNPWVDERKGDHELVLSGITPAHTGGGYTPEQLNPEGGVDTEGYWVVTGPNGTHNYTVASIDTSDAYEYTVVLRPLNRAVPF